VGASLSKSGFLFVVGDKDADGWIVVRTVEKLLRMYVAVVDRGALLFPEDEFAAADGGGLTQGGGARSFGFTLAGGALRVIGATFSVFADVVWCWVS